MGKKQEAGENQLKLIKFNSTQGAFEVTLVPKDKRKRAGNTGKVVDNSGAVRLHPSMSAGKEEACKD